MLANRPLNSPTLTAPGRHGALACGVLLLMALGCGKDKAAKPAGEAKESAKAPAEAAAAEPGAKPAAAPNAGRDALAKAYPVLRCALASGGADDGLWKQHGFEGPAAFATAWQDAANADPGWARNVVSASLRTPCAPPAAPPAAPTPTAAPAAGATDTPAP